MKLGLVLAPFLLIPVIGACSEASADAAADELSLPAGLVDAPLEPHRVELLELAFRTASAIPEYPHVKVRCRLQADVVAACLELEQLGRALEYAGRIGNWQRGEMYAELAFHLAKRGETAEVQRCLDLAEEVARSLRIEGEDGRPEEDGEQPAEQAWRRDRILVSIARTHALLGDEARAARFEQGVVESESGKVAGVRAARLPEEELDEELAALDAFIAGTNLDQARTALDVCAQLHDRFYADAARRARVEERIRAAEPKLPAAMNVELLMELAGHALDHGDPANALALVERAKGFAGACKHVPMVARLAALRHTCGDREKARKEADAARATYEQQRPEITDIYRAGMLRPLAEAYVAMGEPGVALEVYRRAVEEGVGNPNSRPRAEDLAATLLSLARYGLRPDDELSARIYQVFDALGAPW